MSENMNVIQVCCCVFPDGTVFWTDDVEDGPRLAIRAWRSTLAASRREELMDAGATLGCVVIRMPAESYAAIIARNDAMTQAYMAGATP
jgi:hypothetical protein